MQLAESLIRYDRTYLARKLLNEVDDALLYHQLALQISSTLYYDEAQAEAAGLLEMTISSLNSISSTPQRSLITSQYARLFGRFGQKNRSLDLFEKALKEASDLDGRQLDVVKGLIALDQAKTLDISSANETLSSLDAQFVKDSLGSEIIKTERVMRRMQDASPSKSNN